MQKDNNAQVTEESFSSSDNSDGAMSEKPKRGRKPGNTIPVRAELYCPSCGLSLLAQPDSELTCTKCTVPLIPTPKNKAEFKVALGEAYGTISKLRKLNEILLRDKTEKEGIKSMQ